MPSKRLANTSTLYHQILNRVKCPNKPALDLTVPAAHYNIKYSRWRVASGAHLTSLGHHVSSSWQVDETHMELNTEFDRIRSLHSHISFYFLSFLAWPFRASGLN
jgi:hypothetical protein